MKIILNILLVTGLALALLITTKMLVIPHQEYLDDPSLFLYDTGNASPDLRAEIHEQLERFQRGYALRDTSTLSTFMDQLFSRENILILGTMPGEIYSGHEEATELVRSDWLHWGDVNLLTGSANISARDSVAWFSMIGHVVFDLSSWLDLPLRVSGTMVQEETGWKFQQLQFQFDLDISWVLFLLVFLSILLLAGIIRLSYVIIQNLKLRRDQ
jgi:hypothetical protein